MTRYCGGNRVVLVVSTSIFLDHSLATAASLLAKNTSLCIDLHYDNILASKGTGLGEDEVVEEYVEAASRSQGRVYSVHAPYNTGSYREASKLVEAMPHIDARLVVVHPEAGAREAVLEQLLSLAQHSNVVIALENLANSQWSLDRAADIVRTARSQGFENIGLCLDTGHAFIEGADLYKAVLENSDILVAIHVHDNNGARDEHLPPGEGKIPWSIVRNALRDAGLESIALIAEPQCRGKTCEKVLQETEKHLYQLST